MQLFPQFGRLAAALACVVALFAAPHASAADAAGKTILTVTGKIASDAPVTFNRTTLEALGTATFTTATPWFKEPVKFEGVPLANLLKAVGATGQRIVITALNDYSAEIPIEDLKYGVLLALKRDDAYMLVSDKRPIFVVYPFDGNNELKNQKFYARSVWQISRIEVK